MIVELINTGSELMLGRVLNSHQQWLGRKLADLGWPVSRQVAVPDTAPAIVQAVRESLSRADLVITTGGLGPTSDDLTRDAIARMLSKSLKEDAEALAQIARYFTERNRPMPEQVKVQALVPEGATVLPNRFGTAPGLALEVLDRTIRDREGSGWLILLPGPSRELQPMFQEFVVPFLERAFPRTEPYVCRNLRTTGLPESLVEERIGDALRRLVEGGLDLGYCARPGQVDVRLAANGAGASERVGEAEEIVRERLGETIFGTGDEELEEVVVQRLTKLGRTLALAESCTGGFLAHRLTNVPGASAVLKAGLVTYSNQAKREFLGVLEETLESHGAVSEAVAREMAEGARRRTGSDYALAITGIAGPGGGTADKPVGTVFVALASQDGPTRVIHRVNRWDRLTFKNVTTQQALDLLRQELRSSS